MRAPQTRSVLRSGARRPEAGLVTLLAWSVVVAQVCALWIVGGWFDELAAILITGMAALVLHLQVERRAFGLRGSSSSSSAYGLRHAVVGLAQLALQCLLFTALGAGLGLPSLLAAPLALVVAVATWGLPARHAFVAPLCGDRRGPQARSAQAKLSVVAATVFGLGLTPRMPGTMGALAALPIVWWLRGAEPWILLAWVVAVAGVGIVAAELAGGAWGEEDDQRIVIDETAGALLTFVAVPVSGQTLLAGLLLFRLFDIVKPFPLRLLQDRLPGGYGVMLDDLGAGLYALALLHLGLFAWGT